jgi:hypothetical protein
VATGGDAAGSSALAFVAIAASLSVDSKTAGGGSLGIARTVPHSWHTLASALFTASHRAQGIRSICDPHSLQNRAPFGFACAQKRQVEPAMEGTTGTGSSTGESFSKRNGRGGGNG